MLGVGMQKLGPPVQTGKSKVATVYAQCRKTETEAATRELDYPHPNPTHVMCHRRMYILYFLKCTIIARIEQVYRYTYMFTGMLWWTCVL